MFDREGRRPGTAVAWCAACGFGTTAPPPPARQAAPTGLAAHGIASLIARAVLTRELRAALGGMPAGASVLDVGAGGGDRALALARAGNRVTALEPDAAEAAGATARLAAHAGCRVVPVALEDWADDGERYDVALASHVLEHLADPSLALARIAARLRPGGRVVVLVPNAESREASLFGGRWHGWEPARHRWHWSARGLDDLLRASGFGQVAVDARGGWRYPASLAFSIAPHLDPQIPGGPPAIVGRMFAALLAPAALALGAGGRGAQLVATGRVPEAPAS